MSARRLAIRQPAEFSLSSKAKKEIGTWVKKYPSDRKRSALIPAMWIAQKDAGGWLPELALRELGDMLDMAYIRVYEVATFYTMFNLEPVGKHYVQMCGTTPCWLRGSDELKEMLTRKIGPQRSISADGKLSWLEVECLGSCSNAPMVQISNGDGDHYYEDLTAESLEAVLDELVAGKKPPQGPKNGRFSSEPIGGAMALTTKNLSKARGTLKKLPNADQKTTVNYYEWDPKAKRATRKGWVDPNRKASADPKKRSGNLGRDLTAGLVDDDPNKGLPKKASKPAAKKIAKPKVLYTEGATDGAPDDLKLIKGIGPKFEKELNSNGVYYFRQIGAWKVADVKVVEAKIKSLATGRVKRDDWVKQGKALAKATAKKGKT
ncbi:NADH-quinone oxidoreductase subunit NuoE [Hellea balneolensis]|uniref:NADH-quinone oxidoreductase subunit NuoE n=1 Tax=Hellea balneolensis TaxID=287478 RepID=UPI0003F7E275|nr:NADH-quinone oxidoreductase subunit NuoE [Hellea balneolensis]